MGTVIESVLLAGVCILGIVGSLNISEVGVTVADASAYGKSTVSKIDVSTSRFRSAARFPLRQLN